jgi:hypothetical protein
LGSLCIPYGKLVRKRTVIMKCHAVKMFALVAVGSLVMAGSAHAQNYTPNSIQQRYGIQGAYSDTTTHPGGLRSTVVPVTLADGRTGQLVIPSNSPRTDAHTVYYRDAQGNFHPMQMNTSVTRQQAVRAPQAVRYQTEPQHNKQSWEKDALIVGGSAGGGTLIGALAGGKKGAGVGAATGGVGGLIYDLLSRNNKK